MVNRLADLGQVALLLALVGSSYAAVAAAAGARRGQPRLVRSSLAATHAVTALLTVASAVIFLALTTNDYSLKYVQHNSDASMPWFYRLAAYWGGLDGSLMFWAWLLALFSSVAVQTNRERHRTLLPWIVVVLHVVQLFFLALLVFAKHPFDVFQVSAPLEGQGLNPLLQNPYMATHPPALYLGLVSAAVPFAFAMAALITGELDDAWLLSVRRWVLVSWLFLSIGLGLGMLWAYEVLGWGGYWGWDPVENAGALAWFTSTAFLHSAVIQERRGMFKMWNVQLVVTSFVLTIVATFLTRSGVVQSVHAFGTDPVLMFSFLGFIVLSMVAGYGLLLWRRPLLRSHNTLESWLSREFFFLLNNWILLGAALFLLVATLFPSLSAAVTGVRVSLATPFYQLWMSPLGVALLALTGVGPLMAWRRASPRSLGEQFLVPVGAALVVGVGLAFVPGMIDRTSIFDERLRLPVALVNFALCAFVLASVVQEFWRGTRVRKKHTGLDLLSSLIGLVARNKRRYGGYLVHAGVVFMFLGFGGGAYKRETEVTLERGQQTRLGDYTIRFDGLRTREGVDRRVVEAEVVIRRGEQEIGRFAPGKSYFPRREEEPVTDVRIRRGVREDVYMVLNGFDLEAGLANLKLVVHPLVNWIWLGFLVLILGTFVALTPERAYDAAARAVDEAGAHSPTAPTALALIVALGLLGAAPPVRAGPHEEGKTVLAAPRSPVEDELFHKLVCMCGTCPRLTLADCTCGFAGRERELIQRLLSAGKTRDEVIAEFVRRYPKESPLAVPPDVGFNRLAWAAPYGLLLLGALLLVVLARRVARRRPAAEEARPSEAPARDAEMEARLEDELDRLD